MIYLIDKLNWVLMAGFDILFLPLRVLPPFLSLTILSASVGLFMVWVFGRVSNQVSIRTTKDRICANILALLLFQNNVTVFLKVQARIFCLTLKYFTLSLKPMLVMIVPLLLVLIQLHSRFGLRPLEIGETAIITVTVRDSEILAGDANAVRLEIEEGAVVETPPVRIPSKSEVSWRVRAKSKGRHTLTIHICQNQEQKSLIVADSNHFVSERKTAGGLVDLLLHPGEPPLRGTSLIDSVMVNYPPLESAFLGWRINWLVWFFVCSVASGYLLKGSLGVEV